MDTIKKRGNSYLFRCYAGYDAAGRQIEKTMTWSIPAGMTDRKAEKEALHQAGLFEERVRNGQIADERIKFQAFAERWFADYAEVQLRKTTVDRYKDMTRRIYPAIGFMYMDKIRPAHLMSLYKELSTEILAKCKCTIDLKQRLKADGITKESFAQKSSVSLSVLSSIYQGNQIEVESGKLVAAALGGKYNDSFIDAKSGRTLSAKTVQHYHRLISSIMECAVKWQVITANPCDRVEPPKAQQADIEYLDDEQAIHLLELLQTAPVHYKCAAEVLLYTGMRRGELLGLEWSDIDFEHQLISIQRSSLYLAKQGIFDDETKSRSSQRVIKAPSAAVNSLRSLKAWQAQQRLSLGKAWKTCDKVFTALDGAPMHPDTLSGWFHKFIKLHQELPQIHLHSLRHPYVKPTTKKLCI